MATVDGSNPLSEARKANISSRDGGMSAENYLVDCIRQIAPSLSGFRKDDASNLICLCPTHHREFDSGGFVFVPSERQRLSMLEYEERDFAMREESIAQGHEDPGRTFPKLINEFEYIPVIPSPFRIQIHNATPYDPYNFYFDNAEQRPCRLLHFQASHIALMTQAARHLPQPFRIESSKADMAWTQIISLLKLYKRQPRRYSTHVVPVPDIYQQPHALFVQHPQPCMRILPGSPLMDAAPACSTSFTNDDTMPVIPSLSASADDSYQAEHPDADPFSQQIGCRWSMERSTLT